MDWMEEFTAMLPILPVNGESGRFERKTSPKSQSILLHFSFPRGREENERFPEQAGQFENGIVCQSHGVGNEVTCRLSFS